MVICEYEYSYMCVDLNTCLLLRYMLITAEVSCL